MTRTNYLVLILSFISCVSSIEEQELREQSFLFGISEIAENTINAARSSNCLKELSEFASAVRKNEVWSLRMLDASGQQEEGYLFGHSLWIGLMSQCRDISTKKGLLTRDDQKFSKNAYPPYDLEFMSVVLNQNNSMQIQFRIPTNEFIHLGLCLPKSCTTDEFTELLDILLKKKQLLFQQIFPIEVHISGVRSLRDDQINWYYHPFVYAGVILFSITLVLCALGTCYDLFVYQPCIRRMQISTNEKYENITDVNENCEEETKNLDGPKLNTYQKIILCYSLYSNAKVIFYSSTTKSENSLPFIHGIKVWGMFYIVLLHTVLFQTTFTDNAYTAYRLAAMFPNQILSNSSYSVDTFFCLGGFLLSYIFYKAHKSINRGCGFFEGLKIYPLMIFNRYIRLTPAYITTILICYALWQMAAQQYVFITRASIEEIDVACPNYWWRNILYISTFFRREDMCLSWSWYLSDDMQFYAVGCLLLLFSTVFLVPVLYIFGTLIISSVLIGGFTSYIHKYVPTLEEQILQMEIMYDPFMIRMGPYFVGIFAGYLINKWDNKIPFEKKTIRKISFLAILTDLYIIHGMYTRDNLPNLYVAIYMGLSRTVWGITIAWLLMTCISGDAGIINKFLSFRGWQPISRLTYCLYLIHPILIFMRGLTSDRSIHQTYPVVIFSSIGIFSISLIASFFISLLFESPYILLLRHVVKKTL